MYHGAVSYPHLPLAGTQIKVEAALKPFVDEATVGRNLAQTGELPGKKRVLPVFRILLVPQSSLGGAICEVFDIFHNNNGLWKSFFNLIAFA